MANSHMLLWFEAPLQSWGADSKFGRRNTLDFPTKSGVLGLLCAALGAGGEQRELLAEFADLDQTVISFVRATSTDTGLVALDREPSLRDFHMVGSGFNESDLWASLHIPRKNDGKKAVGGGAKMTYRYYRQDAAFAVVVELPEARADCIRQFMIRPVWDIYLGRKSCVPTDFIYRGVFDHPIQALEGAMLIAQEKSRIEDFRVVHGILPEGVADEVITLNDVPLQFGDSKRYRDRQVSLIYVGS